MLRVASVFRVDAILRRKIALMFLAVFAVSALTTANDFDTSRRKPLPPGYWTWQGMVPYQYVRSFRNITISSHVEHYEFTWYQQLFGQLVFHKQQLGLRGIGIADWYRTDITIMSNEDVPAIILAAAIANQGNSPTRPFDINLLEKAQLWIGQTFDWSLNFGKAVWEDKFENPSIGIAQIMPVEGRTYSPWLLFDDKVSISLMLEKLQRTSQSVRKLGISQNDWFALLLLGNNIGDSAASAYRDYRRKVTFAHQSMQHFLARTPANKKQLARMLGYIAFLSEHEGWTIPSDVDMDYLWSLVE